MLPKVPTGRSKTKRQTVNFLGLNYGEGAQDGEFKETQNLSMRKFPALTVRGGREELASYSAPSAIYAWNGLVAVDGTDLKVGGETVATVTPGEKQFAVVNTKLCVFPDKLYVDLTNNEAKALEASVTSRSGTTSTFTTSTLTVSSPEDLGTINTRIDDSYKNYNYPDLYKYAYIRQYTSVSWDDTTKTWTLTGGGKVRAYTDAAVGKYIMLKKDSSSVVNVQREEYWSGSEDDPEVTTAFSDNNDEGIYAEILSVTTTAVPDPHDEYTVYSYRTSMSLKIHNATYASGMLTKVFSAGNPVTITGAATAANNVEKKMLLGVTDTTLTFSDGTFTAGTQTGQITVTRNFPDLDYVCESQNRLWGVSNSAGSQIWNADTESYDTSVGQVIYASALGDPTNFYLFDGTSLDSYTVAVGSEGNFTGICKYDRSVLCFKENTLHRVYGDYPAEYSITERQLNGVAEGASGSLTNIGSVLYYLGRDGVYAFSGNTPTLVSAAFGEKRFTRACAGAVDARYYLSAKDEDGTWGLYVYDTRKGLWLREDDTFALSFATVDGKLHFVNGVEAHTYTTSYTVEGQTVAQQVTVPEGGDAICKCDSNDSTEAVEWSAELSPFTEGTLYRKSPSKITLRCELEEGAWLAAEISCDGEPWKQVFTSAGRDEPTLVIPIMPRRCDAWRLRLSGQGECVIRAIEREFRVGGVR